MSDKRPDTNSDNDSILSETVSKKSTLKPASPSTEIELKETTELSMDLQAISQSILNLEETQDLDMAACQQTPSSPPPSYEHVLAETKLAGGAAGQSGNVKQPVTTPVDPPKGIEIMHKSHKEFYRAVAKQWGITCKMSDHCRCLDCQSMYFECEYDQNEQEKTDGGLGAGTPMFISEVMQGSACNIL